MKENWSVNILALNAEEMLKKSDFCINEFKKSADSLIGLSKTAQMQAVKPNVENSPVETAAPNLHFPQTEPLNPVPSKSTAIQGVLSNLSSAMESTYEASAAIAPIDKQYREMRAHLKDNFKKMQQIINGILYNNDINRNPIIKNLQQWWSSFIMAVNLKDADANTMAKSIGEFKEKLKRLVGDNGNFQDSNSMRRSAPLVSTKGYRATRDDIKGVNQEMKGASSMRFFKSATSDKCWGFSQLRTRESIK